MKDVTILSLAYYVMWFVAGHGSLVQPLLL
jgi:hypothetical protein